MYTILIILFTTFLFLAMVLSLALKPDYSKKVLGATLVLATIAGLILYGYGYSVVESNPVLAVLKALHSACGMIVGGDDLKDIAAAPYIDTLRIRIPFWIIRTMAFYAFAGAVFSMIGSKILERIRVLLSKRGNIILIYGINEQSLDFGKQWSSEKGCSVVFLADKVNNDDLLTINQIGAAVRTEDSAIHPTENMLRSVGIRSGSRKIDIYLMQEEQENYRFANELKKIFEKMDIRPEQTSLLLFGEEQHLAGELQYYEKDGCTYYGFGNVSIFQFHEQISRLMIQVCPPCDTISFDENGLAQDDFHVLILGFGRLGQNILRSIIRNSQFKGSHFKATIFDPNGKKSMGYFLKRYPAIFKEYDIELIETDGRSESTFTYLSDHLSEINYVVTAVGKGNINQEISRQISSYMRFHGVDIPVVSCGKEGITLYGNHGMNRSDQSEAARGIIAQKDYPLFTRENLDFTSIDKIAMKINHRYSSDPNHTLWEDWRECDYFSRMSCRAFASFIPANLRMLHKTKEELLALNGKELELTDMQKSILGETEHIRWCAFHYTMGYTRMSWEEWEKRAHIYQEEVASRVEHPIRIGKDTTNHKHICLIDWEELKKLNEKERAVTGKNPDYQQKDLDNILILPELLL